MTGRFDEYAVVGDVAARRILSADDIDRLGEAILALTGELWILTDRVLVLEEVLKTSGRDVTAEIDSFVPTPAVETRLDARRDRLIGAVLAALQSPRPKS